MHIIEITKEIFQKAASIKSNGRMRGEIRYWNEKVVL